MAVWSQIDLQSKNIHPKGVGFSDFIAVFAMFIVGFFCLFFSNDFLLLISILSDICETLTFVGDYRNCSKCKMLKSVIWLQ